MNLNNYSNIIKRNLNYPIEYVREKVTMSKAIVEHNTDAFLEELHKSILKKKVHISHIFT